MEVVHLAIVFCVRVITGAPSVTARLVFVSTAKWVLMATTVSCVPTTYRDPSADGVNLVTGDSQRVVVKVQTQINISEPPASNGPGTSFSKGPVTFRPRKQSFKSKSTV